MIQRIRELGHETVTQEQLAPQPTTDFPREFAFTGVDFQRIQKLIYEDAGISLAESKQEMVYSRLARRLRAHRLSSFAQYIALLEECDAGERQAFVNALTTNLT